MSKIKSFYGHYLFILLLGYFFCSCERKVQIPNTGLVRLSLPEINSKLESKKSSELFLMGDAPATWSDVDCFGFLIYGPEESMRSSSCKKLNGATGQDEGSLLFGKLYAGYYKNDTVEIEVPSGSGRVITAVGFKTNKSTATGAATACRNLLKQDSTEMSKAFVYAKSSAFNVDPGSSQTVVLPIDYVANSSSFLGDCSGPGAPGNNSDTSNRNPPTHMRMRIQNNLSSLNAVSCVAVLFELLDANGNKAAVNEDFSFTVNESSNNAEFFELDGTYCTNSPGVTSKNLPFFGVSGRYSSLILFMKPATNGTYNFSIVQNSGTTLTIEKPINVNVIDTWPTSGNGPFYINIFDVEAFKGSIESSVSNPIKVQADRCRPAVVQILDVSNRPLKMYNPISATTYQSIAFMESTLSVGFSTLSDCTSAAGSNLGNALNYGDSSFFLNSFYYKVPSVAKGTYFKMKTAKSGTGEYNGGFTTYQVDSTSAVNNKNYWIVEN